ncbi:MAG: hypothetical protein VX527_04025 [Planctomycetota bacterium]|nr:hypothetical protein [Planctomycetota bacterium]
MILCRSCSLVMLITALVFLPASDAASAALDDSVAQENSSESPPQRILEKPVTVSVRLKNEKSPVRVKIERWNRDGFIADSGTYQWDALELESLRTVFRRVMDRKSASDCILLGELLLRQNDPAATRQADIQFNRAMAIDPDTATEIEQVRTRVASYLAKADEVQRMQSVESLGWQLPEGVEWTTTAWPVLNDAQQAEAVTRMKRDIDAWLTKAGYPDVVPIETEYFLFYSDLSRRDTVEIARNLDSMYERVISMLQLPDGINLFWGKCGILVCRDYDRFMEIENLAFNNNRPAGGYFHAIGPRSFVNIYRDHPGFYETMVHETVHAIMHRFLSPVSLPTWANEGFAEYIAANSFRGAKTDRWHRSDGINYIRQRGSVLDVMRMNYADGSWAGPDDIGYAVSYLMVELMIRQNERGFVDWVRAVKAGKPWEQALADQFGSDPATTARIVEQWYRKNN